MANEVEERELMAPGLAITCYGHHALPGFLQECFIKKKGKN
jgi:hypothetical protein